MQKKSGDRTTVFRHGLLTVRFTNWLNANLMNSAQSILWTLHEIYHRLLTHPGLMTDHLKAEVAKFCHGDYLEARLQLCSISIFNFLNRQFIVHKSAFTHLLHSPTIHPDMKENFFQMDKLTHADDIDFCNSTRYELYNQLMAHDPAVREKFSATWVSHLLEKDGRYYSYVHHAKMLLSDDNGVPVLLRVRTERVGNVYLPLFRVFNHHLPGYTETHPYSQLLKGLTFTDRQQDILYSLGQGFSIEAIAEKVNLAESTVRNYHIGKILDKMELKSIDTACMIAKILGFKKE